MRDREREREEKGAEKKTRGNPSLSLSAFLSLFMSSLFFLHSRGRQTEGERERKEGKERKEETFYSIIFSVATPPLSLIPFLFSSSVSKQGEGEERQTKREGARKKERTEGSLLLLFASSFPL